MRNGLFQALRASPRDPHVQKSSQCVLSRHPPCCRIIALLALSTRSRSPSSATDPRPASLRSSGLDTDRSQGGSSADRYAALRAPESMSGRGAGARRRRAGRLPAHSVRHCVRRWRHSHACGRKTRTRERRTPNAKHRTPNTEHRTPNSRTENGPSTPLGQPHARHEAAKALASSASMSRTPGT